MRKFKGDSHLLPQAAFLGNVFLHEGELLWGDGEDLESCFNLFYLPPCWHGYFVFSMKVSRAVFGGPPGEECYVAIRSVPMGWLNSVDVIQNFIRRFVFQTCRLPAVMEVRRDRPIPKGDVAVVCMDGIDILTKLVEEEGTFKGVYKSLKYTTKGRSRFMKRFVHECKRRGLPLNIGKSVCRQFCSTVLGGEVDGLAGVLMHERSKGHKFIAKSLCVLSLDKVNQATVQHWSGCFCFLASFRRPLFSVVQEVFTFIHIFPVTIANGKKCRPCAGMKCCWQP